MNTLGDLKALCNEYRVDNKTRMIAYGFHRTNRKAAMDYVHGYSQRLHIERQRFGPSHS